MTVFLLVLGLFMFIGLVVLHEFGHFVMARRNGVEVEEFGVGFPPRAKLLKKKKGTEYTLNWLPLGGFVKLKGEHDSDTEKGTFGAASLGAKTKIMMAGVFMNLVIAFVLLTLLALVGMPTLISKDNQGEDQFTVASDQHRVTKQVLVNYVEPDSPAQKAGLKDLDRIVSLGKSGQAINIGDGETLQKVAKDNAGQQVNLTYIRSGEQGVVSLKLRDATVVEKSLKTDNPLGYIGIGLGSYEVNRYTWSAPVVAAGLTGQFTKLTLSGLGRALAGFGKLIAGLVTQNPGARQIGQAQATEQVSGPLGIFFVLKAGAHEGINMVVFIVAIISLTLAVMNVLPIPALDGGRLFVMLIYRASRRTLTQKAEELINGAGFAALMLLFVLITFVDVGRFF
jgi:regulator of sigma E protease